MNTLVETSDLLAVNVECTKDTLRVVLSDGRSITVPLAWFPRLRDATPRQRAAWEWIGGGIGIHWEAADEDISIASLLQPESFMRPNKALQSASRASGQPKKAHLARRT